MLETYLSSILQVFFQVYLQQTMLPATAKKVLGGEH